MLGLLGSLAAAANVYMGRRYVEAAATLSRFEVSVRPIPASGASFGVSVEYHNPGPWPIALLEVQVLAWRDGHYVGAATRDLRNAPVVVSPGTSRSVELTLPGSRTAAVEPGRTDEGTQWRFTASGRIELPMLGARSFTRETRYPDAERGER